MKVLILSCNNGSGHNAAAQAVQECFAEHGVKCEIRDGIAFLSPTLSKMTSWLHTLVYCHAPSIFDNGWRKSEENTDLFKENSPARRFLERGRFALGECIRSGGYDAVLCTHVFPAITLTAAKREYALPIRAGVIETDYGNTPGGADSDMDFHFLADASLIPALCAAGVPAERIVPSGIPVKREMYSRTEKRKAREMLGLDPEKPHLLVMSGSMGCGPIPELVERLRQTLDFPAQITVICGSNTGLKKRLRSRWGACPDIRLFDFAPDISLLYDSADLLLTKPGGLSTTEAAAKGLPMAFFDAVGGCEVNNLKYFLEKGGAVTGDGTDALCARCRTLLCDPQSLETMSLALRALFPRNAAEIICSTFLTP